MNPVTVFQQFEKMKVLVVGDVMLDRYLWGKVARISPEAPVPVVEWGSEELRLGGAANVALNVAALGATPVLCGVTGMDADAAVFFEKTEEVNLLSEGVFQSKKRPTTVKTRVIADQRHLLRLDRELAADLEPDEEALFLRKLESVIEQHQFDVVILQDYNKGVLSKKVIARLLEWSRQKAVPVAVDPKLRHFWEYRGVELFKPNLKEVSDALGTSVFPEKNSLDSAAGIIRNRLHNRLTLITLGEKGAYLDATGSAAIFPAKQRMVADVSGAGDTVISVAALALAAGLEPSAIAMLANLAGGQVVEKAGVVPVAKAQLLAEWQALPAFI